MMEFLNGDRYTGCWKNDLFHGTGTYIFNRKHSVSGTFVYGNFQRNELNTKYEESSLKK